MAFPAAAEPAEKPLLWREVWAGADVSPDAWLLYSGATIAPFGHIHEDGLRFRATAGYGAYQYKNSGAGKAGDYHAETTMGDVLVGYLKRFDPLTVKVFAGFSYIEHDIHPLDDASVSNGAEWGAKGVLEFWLNMSEKSWTSLDLAYSTAHDTASVRFRSGYRIYPQLSLGLEGGLNVDGQAQCKMRLGTANGCAADPDLGEVKSLLDYGRTGLFARYEWTGGEISVSGGAVGRVYSSDGEIDFQPYGIVNWISQF